MKIDRFRSHPLQRMFGIALAVWICGQQGAWCQAGIPSPRAMYGSDLPWLEDDDGSQLPKPYPVEQVEAIADNLLLFQNRDGGWPKNLHMGVPLSDADREWIADAQHRLPSTIDNNATHSQIAYLASAYAITHRDEYRRAAERGLEYLLEAQYSNGGWPQFYPNPRGYKVHITYNDNAMVGVMNVLQAVAEQQPQYDFVEPELRQRAERAYARGIDCIVRTQVVIDGRKTVWCQQHDYQTLEPVDARSFEKASLVSGESAEIVLLLMRVREPNEQVVEAVEAAITWFAETQLDGIRIDRVTIRSPDNGASFRDQVVVADREAPPIWARFYELETNRPLFCGRDGKVKYSLAEIEVERRAGYAWYVSSPRKLNRAYANWKARVTEQ
ncbi:pectate lyase [Aeoliella mucimassa]|uniref:Pectic acid lyase n=1 Tax=Aeoliella mucimassa TaxID=2527972 RepID=A0A518AGP2_9BACT|nr:pectate lyase [Aeoliella mucimassa]QDU53882.1 Pectic acid lyase [Aeoliella mucimassa]